MKNVISIVGGLGNQMFQFAYSLTFDKKDDTYLNDYLARNGESNYGSELEHVFGIKMKNQPIDSLLIWFTRKCIVLGSKSKYPRFFLTLTNLAYPLGIIIKSDYLPHLMKKNDKRCCKSIWYGRFQSEQSFMNHTDDVKKAFTFQMASASIKTQEAAKLIIRKNSVSIHVRRGDYLKPSNLSSFGNICTLEYYQKAIRYISSIVENPEFFVFSDDIAWVKEHLELPVAHYIDWNAKGSSWEDMLLMSLCKHNIIANSTFSWWGAWLNPNPDKTVLCPPKYTHFDDSNDFYPESWTKIFT